MGEESVIYLNDVIEDGSDFEIIDKAEINTGSSQNEEYDFVKMAEQKLSEIVVKDDIRKEIKDCLEKISSMSNQFIDLQNRSIEHFKKVKLLSEDLKDNQVDFKDEPKISEYNLKVQNLMEKTNDLDFEYMIFCKKVSDIITDIFGRNLFSDPEVNWVLPTLICYAPFLVSQFINAGLTSNRYGKILMLPSAVLSTCAFLGTLAVSFTSLPIFFIYQGLSSHLSTNKEKLIKDFVGSLREFEITIKKDNKLITKIYKNLNDKSCLLNRLSKTASLSDNLLNVQNILLKAEELSQLCSCFLSEEKLNLSEMQYSSLA